MQSGKVVLQTEFRIEQRIHGHHFGIICLKGAQGQNQQKDNISDYKNNTLKKSLM